MSEHSTLPYNVLPACSAWKVDSTNGDLYYWRAAFDAVDADADGTVAISDIGVCVRARARVLQLCGGGVGEVRGRVGVRAFMHAHVLRGHST